MAELVTELDITFDPTGLKLVFIDTGIGVEKPLFISYGPPDRLLGLKEFAIPYQNPLALPGLSAHIRSYREEWPLNEAEQNLLNSLVERIDTLTQASHNWPIDD
ncbi:MAG: hypothetical protein Q7R49_01170 [Candidatus Daviesbacteria bacterium]|nr:hypothetical protein [Candidatus Daviesbacteria bacterium]